MIIITGTINIPADKRAACIAAIAPLQESTRLNEPGCKSYVLAADPVNPAAISVVECWADAAALEAHFKHPNFAAIGKMIGEHGITGADVAKYRVDAQASVFNAEGAPSASFD